MSVINSRRRHKFSHYGKINNAQKGIAGAWRTTLMIGVVACVGNGMSGNVAYANTSQNSQSSNNTSSFKPNEKLLGAENSYNTHYKFAAATVKSPEKQLNSNFYTSSLPTAQPAKITEDPAVYEWLSENMEVPLDQIQTTKVALLGNNTPLPSSTAAPRAAIPRNIEVSVPFSEHGNYIGDIPVIVIIDIAYFDANRVADLLKDTASPSLLEKIKSLSNGGRISVANLRAIGVSAVWDPASLGIDVNISAKDKAARDIEVAELDRKDTGKFTKEAKVSLFTNLRTSLDYNHIGNNKGLQNPFIDAYVGGRVLGASFENELTYDTGGFGFRRNGSRFVFDNESKAIRTLIGDVRPQVRGYQQGADFLGFSVSSAYQTLQPLRNLRPRGEGSFVLNDPSNVDIIVNGRVVQRVHLDSGSYNLKDFPFLQGENRVSFVAEDRTGRRELAKFDAFFDRELLATNISEWSLSMGSTTTNGERGPIYKDGKFYASGFLRKGVTSNITMGGNLSVEGHSGIAGWEAVWGTKFGTLSWDLAHSISKNGDGNAIDLSFQHSAPITPQNPNPTTFGMAVSAKSFQFSSTDDFQSNNTQKATLSAFFNKNLNSASSISLDGNYSFGRVKENNSWGVRVGYGRRLNERVGLNTEFYYDQGSISKNTGIRLQLAMNLGRSGSATAAYDSKYARTNFNAQKSGQSGFGAWSVNSDIDHTSSSTSVNAGAFLAANRGEIGISHSTSYNSSLSKIADERTSLRIATAFGFADGAIAWGKPVSGAFAIAKPHESLRGRTIEIDNKNNGGFKNSKIFGPALVGNIPNYSRRDLSVDVEDLPTGYDLGRGTISVRAPYNAGYKIVVGSADNLTIIGRALNEYGEPLPFIAAKAKRISDNKEVDLFTNAKGIFSASGMGPGLWTIVFNTNPDKTVIHITIDPHGASLRKLGDLKGVSQ